MDHLNRNCSFIANYDSKIKEAAEKWKEHLENQKLKSYNDIRSFFGSCNDFIMRAS